LSWHWKLPWILMPGPVKPLVPLQFCICTLPPTVTDPSSSADAQPSAWTLPPIDDHSSRPSTVRLAFCRTCTLPLTFAWKRVQVAPAGTTRLPATVPVIDPLHTVSAPRADMPPAASAASETVESSPNLKR
jgi:hypothetical protein